MEDPTVSGRPPQSVCSQNSSISLFFYHTINLELRPKLYVVMGQSYSQFTVCDGSITRLKDRSRWFNGQ